MLCKRVKFALPEVRIIEENRKESQNYPQAESTLQVTSQKVNDQQNKETKTNKLPRKRRSRNFAKKNTTSSSFRNTFVSRIEAGSRTTVLSRRLKSPAGTINKRNQKEERTEFDEKMLEKARKSLGFTDDITTKKLLASQSEESSPMLTVAQLDADLMTMRRSAYEKSTEPSFHRDKVTRRQLPHRATRALRSRAEYSKCDVNEDFKELSRFNEKQTDFLQHFTPQNSGLALSEEMQARVQQRLASELGLQVDSLPDNATLLWENQVVSEIAAPMNGTLYCAAQLPIGTGGVALRYQRSSRVGVRRVEDLKTDELFAFAPTAHDAASLVQRLYRRVKRKKWRSAVRIQARVRSHLARAPFLARLNKVKSSATLICRMARRWLSRRELSRRKVIARNLMAVRVQTAWRYHTQKFEARDRLIRLQNRSANTIQKAYVRATQRSNQATRTRTRGSIAIQRVFRGFADRRRMQRSQRAHDGTWQQLMRPFFQNKARYRAKVRRYAKRSFSALRLQCAWRRVAAKHSFDTRVNALDVIQRSMRRMLGALAFERERQRRENEAIHEVAESTVAVSDEYLKTKEGKHEWKQLRIALKEERKPRKALDDEQRHILQIKDAFEMIDRDGTGTIDKEEFRSVIREMGNPMAAQDIEKAFFTVDTDNSGQLEFNEFKDWFLRMEQDHAPLGPARSVLKLGLLLKRTFVTNLFQVDIRRLARRRIVVQRRGTMVYHERGLYRQREPPYLHLTHTTACKYACPTCLRGFTSAGFLARHVDKGTCTIYDTLTLGLREDATANAVGAAVSGLNPRKFMTATKTGDGDGSNAADEVVVE